MSRSMTQLYIRQWKTLSILFIFYIVFGIISCKMFDEDIGKPSACFNPNTLGNNTCLKKLEDDSYYSESELLIFVYH